MPCYNYERHDGLSNTWCVIAVDFCFGNYASATKHSKLCFGKHASETMLPKLCLGNHVLATRKMKLCCRKRRRLSATRKTNQTRYTPHRRTWRFGHFSQLALTFVHQHFLQGTSAYLLVVPFFQCFRRRCSAVKNWVGDMGPWCDWNTSSETIGERTVWPSFFCVALIWAGSHPNFKERHALSIIWVPARQGRVEAFWAVLRVIFCVGDTQLPLRTSLQGRGIPMPDFHPDRPQS